MTVDRILSLSSQADYNTANKIAKWLRNYTVDLTDPEVLSKVEYAITKADKAYNPKKGNLFTYIKMYISLDLINKDYLPRADIINSAEEVGAIEIDLSHFSDKELIAMYNVKNNNATQMDIAIVKGLVHE